MLVCLYSEKRSPLLKNHSVNTYLWVPKAHPQLGKRPPEGSSPIEQLPPSSIIEGSLHSESYVCVFGEEKPSLEDDSTDISLEALIGSTPPSSEAIQTVHLHD